MGAIWANWSKVKHCPPAWVNLALAALVNLRATTLIPVGTWRSLLSLVTLPTTATILEVNLVSSFPLENWSLARILLILDNEIG